MALNAAEKNKRKRERKKRERAAKQRRLERGGREGGEGGVGTAAPHDDDNDGGYDLMDLFGGGGSAVSDRCRCRAPR
jgi:hypothetical protein